MQRHQISKFIRIRNFEEGDIPFLFATYLKHNWYSKENSTTLKKETWLSFHRNRLNDIIRQNHAIKMVCLAEDPESNVGYGFIDDDKPFIYIKLAWRNDK